VHRPGFLDGQFFRQHVETEERTMSRETIRTLNETKLDSVRGGVQTPDGGCRLPGPACDRNGSVQLNPETSDSEEPSGPRSIY
jgi:hypothetical protein